MAFRQNNLLLKQARAAMARKRFGQNFLIHAGLLDGIVRCLELTPADTVVEIGPGLGFLTERLLPQCGQLIAVELENAMVAHLRQKFGLTDSSTSNAHPSLTLVQQDFLAYPLENVPAERFKVVGNIPYNITSSVLFKLVGELTETEHALRSRIPQITLLVQKEVAERIAAQPGSKAYGPLSIASQYHYQPEVEFWVPPEAFEPMPKVQSAVISLLARDKPLLEGVDVRGLNRIVRMAFQQRRKMMKNTLAAGLQLPEATVVEALQAVGLEPTVRPEQVPIATFGALTDALAQRPC